MKRPTDRRTVLLTAGAVAVAAATSTASAQSGDIRGTVVFEGSADIPKGQLEIYLEDPGVQDKARRRASKTSVDSGGGDRTISFVLSAPERASASSKLKVVARLERADGWLLARGSVLVEPGSPVKVTLNTVTY